VLFWHVKPLVSLHLNAILQTIQNRPCLTIDVFCFLSKFSSLPIQKHKIKGLLVELLSSTPAVAKALNVNGISCPDNRKEGAEQLASFLGTTLKPPPQTPSSNHTDQSPLSAALKDKFVATPSHPPVAPGLPSMTSAEQHVWHFCTSCAARVCNACGYRDERRRHR
jgi:hypothetical protein